MIILTGMAFSGKSSLGKILANKLKLPFIDLDEYIETKTSHTINDIFKYKSEKFFRKLELRYLKEILKSPEKKVISLGGGAFIQKEIQRICLQKSTVFFVNTDINIIFSRIQNCKTQRPLFTDISKENFIKIYENRKKEYLKAHFNIKINHNYNNNDAVSEIIKLYQQETNGI